VSRVAATPVTYSSLSLEVNNDPNDPNTMSGSDPQDMADHVTDVSAAMPVESQFLGALSSFGTETYDGPMSPPAGTNGPLAFVPTSITAPTNTFIAVEPVPPGSFSLSGSSLLGFAPAPFQGANTFFLSTPVTAFGTYIANAGDGPFTDTLSLLLQNSNNPLFSETVPIGTIGNADPDNIFYFGVTDANNPFDEVTLLGTTNNPSGDGVLLDNTSVGFAAPVPEPSSLALVCGGLLIGLAAFCVRRATARRGTATVAACGNC
jgi:hypothetical protein